MELKDLSRERLSQILQEILTKEGYLKITLKQDHKILIGTRNEGLNQTSHLFYLYTDKLSGDDVNKEEIYESLRIFNDKYKTDIQTLVSPNNISGSMKSFLERKISNKLKYIEPEQLNDLIKKHYPNFWAYERFDLVKYERYFLEEMSEQSALKNIQGLEEKVKRLLDVYIKPRIFEVKEDLEHKDVQFNKVTEEEIASIKNSAVIEGDTGSGKSTILKEIGKKTITRAGERRILPIFITPIVLIRNDFNIKKAIEDLLSDKIGNIYDKIVSDYDILILLDSIDEFETENRNLLFEQLYEFKQFKYCRFIISTRSAESCELGLLGEDVSLYRIDKFNSTQVKEFAIRYFRSEIIAEDLINSLTDNRILERLPLTPLSLSLIALVFEKDRREIPATMSDIYDNFNQLILGKVTATKKFELITFAFRERILSLYAFALLKDQEVYGSSMSKDEFINYFQDYFQNKSSDVESSIIEEFLDYFITSSGILELKDGLNVQFSHRSFLEYYGSLEIFKHQRKYESILVKNFTNLKWQNVAVFYAGQSKDLPDFLKAIIEQVKKSNKLDEHANAVAGLGYLLQALYQTDNKLRAEAVEIALSQHLLLHEAYEQLATQALSPMFKNMRLPVISVINMYLFYLNYLSSTLVEPMRRVFEKLFIEYQKNKNTSTGYKLLTLAATFHSQRLNDSSFLEKLIDETKLLNDPILTNIANISLYFDNSESHKEIKKLIVKSYKKFDDINKALVKKPARNLRFTALDTIHTDKRTKIITEGKTDAQIIEHAFSVLTNSLTPYWNIKPSGFNSGSAQEVQATLNKSKALLSDDETIIGVFDNDTEGQNQFNGLNSGIFEKWKSSNRVKKMKEHEIYGIKIPVPWELEHYLREDKELNYFAIEHYFDIKILKEHNIVKESTIDNVYKINKGKSLKRKFADFIVTQNDPIIFRNFISLFKTIDEISGQDNIDYFERL